MDRRVVAVAVDQDGVCDRFQRLGQWQGRCDKTFVLGNRHIDWHAVLLQKRLRPAAADAVGCLVLRDEGNILCGDGLVEGGDPICDGLLSYVLGSCGGHVDEGEGVVELKSSLPAV